MDLTTRCPQCGTTFSASLEQLQLRKGYIRCINCAHIFDGYEAVISPGEAPAPDADRPPHAAEPRISMPSVLRQRPAGADERAHTMSLVPDERDDGFTISAGAQVARTVQDPVFHVGGNGLRTRNNPAMGEADDGSLSGPHVARDHPEIYIEPRYADRHDGEAPVRTFEFMTEPSGFSIKRLLWRLLVVLGLLLALAQLAYVYRAQIANNVPVLRPVLERVCASLDCQVPYARQIDQIAIMDSSLRSGSGASAGDAAATKSKDGNESEAMLLRVTLRNTYDKPQEWPTLVLDLKDASGAILVRKNLPPQSYLPANVWSKPFQAGGEITASVPIVPNGVKVNGYQLDKFFQ